MKLKSGAIGALLTIASAIPVQSFAQVASFEEAVKEAVVYSPRVNAAWYNLMATSEALQSMSTQRPATMCSASAWWPPS